MSAHHVEESVEIDIDAMDTPAQRLAERYKAAGMTSALAEKLVAVHGANAFGMGERLPPELADGWRMTAFRIWQSSQPRLSTGAFLMAAGWLPPGIKSQRDLARHFKVSVEHVSNLVEEWQGVLGLPRTEYQKSAKAVEAARAHHKKNRSHHVGKK